MFLATAKGISQSPGTGEVLSFINLDIFPPEFSGLGDQSDCPGVHRIPATYYLPGGAGVLGTMRTVTEKDGVGLAPDGKLDVFAETGSVHGR